LTGVAIELGDPITVVGADGFRLAYKVLTGLKIPKLGKRKQVIFPRTSVTVLKHLWKYAAKKPVMSGDTTPLEPSIQLAQLGVAKRLMKVSFAKGRMTLRFGEVQFTSQLLEGDFPDYRKLVPADQELRVVVDSTTMALALRRLAPIASQGANIIRLNWEDKEMVLSAKSEDAGEMELKVSVESQGGPAKIAFNGRLLHDYFENCKSGPVMLEVTTVSSPGLFTHQGMPQVVLMPMFVQWEGEPPLEVPDQQEEPDPNGTPDEPVEDPDGSDEQSVDTEEPTPVE